jgi:hypothetical protein
MLAADASRTSDGQHPERPLAKVPFPASVADLDTVLPTL